MILEDNERRPFLLLIIVLLSPFSSSLLSQNNSLDKIIQHTASIRKGFVHGRPLSCRHDFNYLSKGEPNMNMKCRKGFTLTELITVLAVLSILMTMAVMSLHDHIKRTRLRKTAEAVDADLRQARWIARMTGEICAVAFDAVNRTYTINGKSFARIPEGIRFGADSSVTGKPKQPYSSPPADGISFDFGSVKNIARFYPTGVVAPSGSVFLTDGEETMAVTVATTGRSKMWLSCGGKKWVAL
jgi:prepilin-type N-terminal cleavage/methylation domain-containing protein